MHDDVVPKSVYDAMVKCYEELVLIANTPEFKRSSRDLKDFAGRLDSADDIEFIGVDPDAPF
jgi:hypothetical protein